ncbi:MAG TPA: formate dehydrogenase, partial [Beutenbergiaceae bacterium]|nr:formate dehydrogenase [Beutenbergiaceae bacterium]
NAVTKNSGRDRTTAFCYALGWTQHSSGAQFIRTSGILQLLLGNMGRPGGGIMALRGHASIQGSTDIPTLFNLLPGYLPMPVAGEHDTLEDYLAGFGDPKGFWSNADGYTVSMLRAWWGDASPKEEQFSYIPRLTGPHGTYQTTKSMLDGEVEGYFLLGQNPAVGSANGRMQRLAMMNLKWLVVRDLNMIESATFWKDGPEIANGERSPEDIDTEVFFLPAASYAEKSGSFTQTQRLLQWRHQAVRPPGEADSELEFFYRLGLRLKELVAESDDPRDKPLQELTWDYGPDADPEKVLAEINGYQFTSGEPLDSFTQMKSDGSTAGGCWIYTGVFAGGVNHAANRHPATEDDPLALKWGWAWPANRRILYNRASADPQGKPWSERKKHVWWSEQDGKWVGVDVPDFVANLPPGHVPDPGARGVEALGGDDAFIMNPDGKGRLFSPDGMVDGPLPTHYEP